MFTVTVGAITIEVSSPEIEAAMDGVFALQDEMKVLREDVAAIASAVGVPEARIEFVIGPIVEDRGYHDVSDYEGIAEVRPSDCSGGR